jgi:hypothetical protein
MTTNERTELWKVRARAGEMMTTGDNIEVFWTNAEGALTVNTY